MHFLEAEFKGLYQFLRRNKNETVVLSGAALFISLDHYQPIWNDWFSSLFYFAVCPVLVIILVLRRSPLDYGFRFGNAGLWGRYVGIFILAAAPILFFTGYGAEFQDYYRSAHFNLASYFFIYCATLFGSEYLFRGFLIFGLKERFKESAILIQMIPFVLVHLGKPELETISTIITGILFGYVVYRGNSFWPAFIIHLFINVFFVASVNLLH